MSGISASVIPIVMFSVALIILSSNKPHFDAFFVGAAEGAKTCAKLLPALCALLVAIEMLFASGAIDVVGKYLSDFTEAVGIPSGMLPLMLTRPVSGAASAATYSELLKEYGADSYTGLCASILMGSSDTVIYILSVYFSAAGVKRTRYAFAAAFIVMLFSIFFSAYLCRLFFGFS